MMLVLAIFERSATKRISDCFDASVKWQFLVGSFEDIIKWSFALQESAVQLV